MPHQAPISDDSGSIHRLTLHDATFTIILLHAARILSIRADFAGICQMGISELIIVLVLALIVIPPEKLPEVMRTFGKIMRELRLASNTVVREITEVVEDPLSIRQPPPSIAKPPIASSSSSQATSADQKS
jgi:Sec-independent protein translocase protein TatA